MNKVKSCLHWYNGYVRSRKITLLNRRECNVRTFVGLRTVQYECMHSILFLRTLVIKECRPRPNKSKHAPYRNALHFAYKVFLQIVFLTDTIVNEKKEGHESMMKYQPRSFHRVTISLLCRPNSLPW